MKKNLMLICFCYTIAAFSQVGINTSAPQATFDLHTKSSTSSTKAMRITNSNNVEVVTVTDAGRVGIGKVLPEGALHVLTTSGNGIISERANSEIPEKPPYLALRRNNSTDSSINKAVIAGNYLGAITFAGNTGNGYEGDNIASNAAIVGVASENFSTNNQGSEMRFYTVPNGTAEQERRMTITNDGKIGIGRTPITNILEVAGEASKNTAGSWLGNSDARLKKDIQQIPGNEALEKLLKLKGVYYYWNDDKTGINRPKEKQMGFIAQNIQEVFPDKVTKDGKGYLQTAYGDYDAVIVEALRALYEKNQALEKKIKNLELLIHSSHSK